MPIVDLGKVIPTINGKEPSEGTLELKAEDISYDDYDTIKSKIIGVDDNVSDIAGEGRTTETVKGNADAIASHMADLAKVSINVLAPPVPLVAAEGDGTTDDTEAIQNIIDSYIGRTIIIPSTGYNYIISSELSIPSNTHIVLYGSLYLANGSNCSVMCIEQDASNIIIEGFGTIDGNKTNNATFGTNGNGGIVTPFLNKGVTQNVNNVYVSGLTIQNCFNWGLNLAGTNNGIVKDCIFAYNNNSNQFSAKSYNCQMISCEAYGTNDIGIAIYGGCYQCVIDKCISHDNPVGSGIAVRADTNLPYVNYDIILSNNVCYNNISSGIDCTSTLTDPNYDIQIISNSCFNNGTTGNISNGGGITLTNGKYITITSNNIHDNGGTAQETDGIFINACIHVLVDSNRIRNIKGDFAIGIRFKTSSSHIQVINNEMFDDQTSVTMYYLIYIPDGDNIWVENNYISHPAKVSVTGGTNITFRNNRGYVTEASGTATIPSGSTYVEVTHGLNKAPNAQHIKVTPTNSMGSAAKFYIANVNSTVFRIYVNADPGATTATFVWSAIVN